jgi:hypothetical protein
MKKRFDGCNKETGFLNFIMKGGEKEMKKTIVVGLIALLSVVSVYGFADAKVSGLCSDCHTMHFSQNGIDPVGATGPNAHLLLNSCLGCHAGTGIAGAPLVDGTDLTYTAGGSFANAVTADAMTHNVVDGLAGWTTVVGVDDDLGNDAPGGVSLGAQLKCAGVNGCHGSHVVGETTSDQGIKGFHHDSTSYAYLRIAVSNSGEGTDVYGIGSSTWEKTAGGGALTSNHNVYCSSATEGISKFCANCHNTFHATTSSGGSWIRHPTDNPTSVLAGTPTVDVLNNPYAFTRAQIDGPPAMLTTDMATGTAYTAANGQVMCMSCHRAHATKYADILRWDYTSAGGQKAGGGGVTYGCLGCHYNQR